jgi:DNA-binding PadR family transcriptional regulator
MSLGFAILSILVANPCSGYDLAKRFNPTVEGSVGFFWTASFQQIYRELGRLEEKGWLQAETIQQETRPDKRIYSVTDLGKHHLREWITEAEKPSPIRDELLVKLNAGYLADRASILSKLRLHHQQHHQRLTIYQEIEQRYFQDPKTLSANLQFSYLTLLAGIHYETGWLTWCDRAIQFLEETSV